MQDDFRTYREQKRDPVATLVLRLVLSQLCHWSTRVLAFAAEQKRRC
jgi:hypothetical protein